MENLRLYEPPRTDDQEENVKISSIEEFSLEYLNEFAERHYS